MYFFSTEPISVKSAIIHDNLRYSNNVTVEFQLNSSFVSSLTGTKFKLTKVTCKIEQINDGNYLECMFPTSKIESADSYCKLISNSGMISLFSFTIINLKPGCNFDVSIQTYAEIDGKTILESDEYNFPSRTSNTFDKNQINLKIKI